MRGKFVFSACCCALVSVAPIGARVASAGTVINVTTTADDMTTNGNCTLREALKAAATHAKVDKCSAPSGTPTVKVPAGTYQLSLGELSVTSRVNLIGAGPSTVIKGSGTAPGTGSGVAAPRVLHVRSGAVVEVSNLTAGDAWTAIRNDGVLTVKSATISNTGYDAYLKHGNDLLAAGLDNRGQATLVNVAFDKNGGPAQIGLPTIVNPTGKTVTIMSSTFTNGMHNDDVIDNSGQLNISASTFDHASDNEHPDSAGIDIYNTAGGNAVVTATTFKNEAADAGIAAISNYGTATADHVVIDQSMGALWNHGTMHVTNSTISNNNYGDIIDNYAGSLQMATTTITGNTPSFRAMIDNIGGSAVLVNVTITDNRLYGGDGNPQAAAIDNYAKLTARNITVANNLMGFGTYDMSPLSGGIANAPGKTFSLANSIIAGNSNGNATSDTRDCRGTFDSLGWNLVQVNGGCTFNGTTTGNIYGKGPLLGALANNGGPTQTLLPQPGSPAIDAGNPSAPAASPPQRCPLFDQRNVPRPRDGNGDNVKRCDIGAVER